MPHPDRFEQRRRASLTPWQRFWHQFVRSDRPRWIAYVDRGMWIFLIIFWACVCPLVLLLFLFRSTRQRMAASFDDPHLKREKKGC